MPQRRRDVGVKVQFGRSEGGGERERATADDDDASGRAFLAVTACACFPREVDPIPRSGIRIETKDGIFIVSSTSETISGLVP